MACIKEVNRSASVALSPDGPYMATGTMAGAVDVNFSTSASLEIFKLDFQSDDHDLPLLAESISSERFNRLSWGKKASQSEEFPYGVIAGGLIDGTVCLWNPAPLIRSEANCNAVVWQSSKHKGPVRGLEFNTNSPYLLASGADDGEISIWDFTTIENPQHFPPLKGTGSASQGEISYLSWNCKVHHILASTSYNGTTVVWDLRKQKPVISFADSTRRRCSVLQWNPDAATQLVVASDDDDSPALRLWDMRNVMSPVKEFVGHTKGVISMSWCHTDSSYLLTCAKDNRTICWDTVSGEIVCELPAGTNWNFDVHWYSKIPGVISASSFDGKVGIYNIEACSRYGTGEVDFVPAPLRAPKWYKRPVGVSFGFGGKLVSFQSTRAGTSEVYVHSIVTEDSLVNRSSEFEAAIQSRERPSLKVLCEKKSQESESEDDRETWSFLKVMFEDDGSARTNLLSHLGFSVPEDITETVQDDISEQVDAFGLDDNVADKSADLADKETAAYSYDNGEDFFNNLPSPKADTPVSTSANTFVGEAVPSEEQVHVEPDGLEESEDPAFDDAVQRALVVGDYKGAVAHCLSANKMADALVIAHVGGAALWESTRNQYLKISRSPYLKVVSAMVNHDLMSLVNSRPLKSWKETLALLCSFAQGEEWPVLCDTLGAKLLDAGNTLAATLCYICAGNIDQTVEIWSQRLSVEPEGKSYVDRLQDLMEKTIVFAIASGQKRFSSFLCKLVEKYAEILTSQGQLSTAMEYLKLLGEELSPELVILRDRITVSSDLEKEAEQKLDHDSVVSSAPGYGDQPNLQPYYQDNTNNYVQPTPAVSQYNGNYQQPFPDKSFTPPMPYQQQPQDPKFFVPSPVQPPTQPNFPSASAGTQPVVKPFVPAAPPALKDANKYQQQGPTNPGFQLSNPGFQPSNPGFQPSNPGFQPSNPGFQPSNPGFQPSNPGYQPSNPGYQPTNPGYQPTNPGYQPTNPGYQPGPPGPGSMQPPAGHRDQRFSPVAAAAPAPMGFVPVNTPGIGVQRPGMPMPQPSTPAQPAPQPTNVAPPAPPPTVQTADTSNVPAHQKPVIATLTRLFKETSEAVGGANANPGKKREIDDNSRKLGALFAKLNTGDISKNAGDKLVQICQALDNSDYATALQIQVQLTTSDWDECSFWLGNLKRMIRARQNVR